MLGRKGRDFTQQGCVVQICGNFSSHRLVFFTPFLDVTILFGEVWFYAYLFVKTEIVNLIWCFTGIAILIELQDKACLKHLKLLAG